MKTAAMWMYSKYSRNFVLQITLVFSLAGLFASHAHAYTVEITQAELQAMVERGFPIVQQTPYATTKLSQPKVSIVNGSKRLRLGVSITGIFPGNLVSSGRAEIEGEPDYQSDKGEFHLREPVLTSLHFDRLPAEYQELMGTLVSAIVRQTLPIIVIYRLDTRDLRQSTVRRMLKSISVKNGKLIAELDW